jgi:hypothetical protein
VISQKLAQYKRLPTSNFHRSISNVGLLFAIGLCVLLWALPISAQTQQPPSNEQTPAPQSPGSISGKIIDQTGTFVSGAQVKLTQPGESSLQQLQTGDDGQFSFSNVAPGEFQIVISAEGFSTKTVPGTLHAGEAYAVPQITLALATEITEVHVSVSQVEIAEVEIKEQEKQRVFGIIPNFFVTYSPDPAPLNTRQKLNLAWKSSTDPLSLAGVGFVAGIEQAQNAFSGYGQGTQGYGKRYGASYADLFISTFLGSAILPAAFKQDPRYFYKGTGSTRSRLMHALASSVMCRGDNKRWGPNYSNIFGSLATGAISNLYYPSSDRNGPMLTFETALIRIGESAGANVFQEFVIRKLTPGLSHKSAPVQQQP